MSDLAAFLEPLRESDDSVFVLSRDLRIVRTNAGYARFANDNGGAEALGRSRHGMNVLDAISPPLRAFYARVFAEALSSGERAELDYECSSPARFRRFRMVVYPIDGEFLVVVNSLVSETEHAETPYAPSDATYAVEGLVTMCGHCRRVRRPGAVRRWDWVPAYVATPGANISHGLCDACAAFYYGDLARPLDT
jgi:PAS fold